MPRTTDHVEQGKGEKVIIILHGVSGDSGDSGVTEMAGFGNQNGYNIVVFNHQAPKGESGLRMMDMSERKHLDECIEFVKDRFDSKDGQNPSELYLMGFSLGANHVLRYMGANGKEQWDIENENISEKESRSLPDGSE